MKRGWLYLVMAGLLCGGCEYTVSLVDQAAAPIDRAWLGRWRTTDAEGDVMHLVVLEMPGDRCLVMYPADGEKGLFFEALPCEPLAGRTLVQLQLLGTAKGKPPPHERRHHFAAVAIEDGRLQISLLNSERVSRAHATRAELAAAIAAQADAPDLFLEPVVFERP